MGDIWITKLGRRICISNASEEKYEKNTIVYDSKSFLYNTKCPVCSSEVYFCRCSNGGRVFFDTLYPLWDKHPCTITSEIDYSNSKGYSLILPILSIEKKHEITFQVPNF